MKHILPEKVAEKPDFKIVRCHVTYCASATEAMAETQDNKYEENS